MKQYGLRPLRALSIINISLKSTKILAEFWMTLRLEGIKLYEYILSTSRQFSAMKSHYTGALQVLF